MRSRSSVQVACSKDAHSSSQTHPDNPPESRCAMNHSSTTSKNRSVEERATYLRCSNRQHTTTSKQFSHGCTNGIVRIPPVPPIVNDILTRVLGIPPEHERAYRGPSEPISAPNGEDRHVVCARRGRHFHSREVPGWRRHHLTVEMSTKPGADPSCRHSAVNRAGPTPQHPTSVKRTWSSPRSTPPGQANGN